MGRGEQRGSRAASFKEFRRSGCLLQREGAIAKPLAPGFTILKPVLKDGRAGIATLVQ